MKKSFLKKMVMMTLAMGAMYVPSAFAEEAQAPQEFALDEVVVTANRMENKLVDTPANVSVVTAEEIEKRNYQDAIEAVKNVPGVNVLEGTGSDDKFISIGGSDRVLVLVNGRRIGSDQGFSTGNGKLDAGMLPNPAAIERIEVLKGGGATVYGADAVGGVVNIITKKAQENMFKIDVNTGSWGTQNYKGIASVKEGKTGVFVAASKSKQNYMRYKEVDSRENKKWHNSNSEKVSVNLRVEQEISDDQLLSLYYDHLNKKGGKPGSLFDGDPEGRNYKIDNNVALRYDWNTDSSNTGYVQVYRNNSNNEYVSPTPGRSMKTKEHRTGFDVQQTMKTAEANTMVIGASYYSSNVDTDSMGGYDKDIRNKAIYVQDSWDFAPTWKLNTGLRYDNHSEAGSKTTASVAVNKKFNDASHAYIGWSQVFNAPDADDMYNPGGGNPNLKAEKGDTFNAGYETRLGRKSNVGINVFYSKLKDAIKWAQVDPSDPYVWSPLNVYEQKRRGLELNYKYDFDDNWAVFANYTYVKVEENESAGGKYARDLNQLPNQFKFGVSYNKDRWNVDLVGRGASGGSKAIESNGWKYSASYLDSSYLTLDLSVTYKVKDNWKVYAKGYNLTNASYAERAGASAYTPSDVKNYDFPAAGRRFLIGTEFTF